MNAITQTIQTTATPAAVYAALTTPEGIQGWWSTRSTVGAAVGETHQMTFDKDGRTVVMTFEITALEADRLVEWRCIDNGNPLWIGSTLRFEVHPEGKTTTLHFRQDGFTMESAALHTMTAQGWGYFVGDSLKRYLETGEGGPWG